MLLASRTQAQDSPVATEEGLVRQNPDSARQAIEGLLAVATAAGPSTSLESAEQLASEFAVVWNDSVPYRTVVWFREAEPDHRAAKVAVDSLRRAGGKALRTEGTPPALLLWRSSLKEARRIADSIGAVAATVNIGVGFYTDGQPDSARGYLQSGYRLALTIHDYRAAGTAAGTLASIAKDRGDLRDAAGLYRQAVSLHQRVGDTRGLAADHNNLGLVAAAVGDTVGAREAYERALALNRRFNRTAAAAANLVNLGTLADLQGDFAGAARLYRQALDAYSAAADHRNTGLVLRNLGRLELRRGNYRAAVSNLQQALSTLEGIGPTGAIVTVRIDLARALAESGDVEAAVTVLEQAESAAEPGALTDREAASLSFARAEMEARLNRMAAADRYLVRAERYFQMSGDPAGQADAQEQRALLEARRGENRSARERLRLALRARDLAGDARATASTRLLLGFVEGSLGDTTAARLASEEARATFARVGDAVGEAVALGALAQLAQGQGLRLSADSLFAAALTGLEGYPAPMVAWWLHLGRGEALHASRKTAAAAAELRASIAQVERSSGAFTLPANRAAFMADKWQPYAALARLNQSLGETDSAFAISERMRAQEMLEMLASGRAVFDEGSSPTSKARELRQRIMELSRQLTVADPDASGYRGPELQAASQEAVREALTIAEEKYARILERLRHGGGDRSALAAGAIVSARDLQQRLGSDEAFLEYLVSDSTSMVFVVTSDSVVSLELQVGAKTLWRLVDFAREMTAPDAPSQGRELWRPPLQRLYAYLISPVEKAGLLIGRRRLFIVPHSTLHYLPFAALIAPGQPMHFLVERFSIAYAPSASIWTQLSPGAPDQSARTLLMLAPMDRQALPGAEAEVRRIASAYGTEATSLFGQGASERAFRDLAPEYDVVHLASFGVLNKQNPLFSYVTLQPATELDGRLEVHEILGLSLRASLVVLSACQTALGSGALGDIPAGDDWVGLMQAFLYAGATRVMATLWPVPDRQTASLMTEFYARLRGGVPDDLALAEAQRHALLRRSTSHPRHWAGFVLTGGRSARNTR
jgi:CHAT domain-containing protein/Tfp pilus assembly protein PilF